MPAKDIFHDIVKKALLKEKWTITDEPLLLQFGGFNLYADLGAEKRIAAIVFQVNNFKTANS
jgi:hypothetical protein